MTVEIRQVQPGDAARWVALRSALWPEGSPDEHAAEVAAFFGGPARPGLLPEAVFVAEETGGGSRLIGFAEISRRAYAEGCDSSPVAYLEGWYVAPERRRRGIGRALVARAEAWARSVGCTEFASDALADNLVSAEAHRALGFDEVEVVRCFRKSIVRGAALR